jgi:hypothetical protein
MPSTAWEAALLVNSIAWCIAMLFCVYFLGAAILTWNFTPLLITALTLLFASATEIAFSLYA